MSSDNSQPTNSEIPDGYLSNAEIADKHPKWAQNIERGASSVLKSGLKKEDCMKVMVYLNEPAPVITKLWSTPEDENGNTELTKLPNKKEIPMLAMDALYLIGDPTMRLDLEYPPSGSNINPQPHKNSRLQVLENSFRNPARKWHFDGQKSMYYGSDSESLLLDIQDTNNTHKLWGKVPDLRIKVGAGAHDVVEAPKSMTERVTEAMERCEVPLNSKQFKTEQIQKVKNDLLGDADMYGYADQIKGKHSDEHIRIMMKDAVEENVNKTASQ